ncbi:MAG TPA: SpoIIE family protein phosphatase [Polyangiaceae bacterium]|nr:SpoIIE family protein phosphatase [Polyangiaceae bacterium]
MSAKTSVTIRLKLGLLAGLPVLGALVLAAILVRDARLQVQKAEGLGTIEHLAQLSNAIGQLVNALQTERAQLCWLTGQKRHARAPRDSELPDFAQPAALPPSSPTSAPTQGPENLEREYSATDKALKKLDAFLQGSSSVGMPERLGRDLREARKSVEALRRGRLGATDETDFHVLFERYGSANRALIQSTAALTDLTDNGELLRPINSLVAVLELTERASQEQGLLAHVFALGRFPPGSYRSLVTLLSERKVYEDVFRTSASAEQLASYERALKTHEQLRASELRKVALESTTDELTVDPADWLRSQDGTLKTLNDISRQLNTQVKSVAVEKIAESRRAEIGSISLVGIVLLVSVTLAGFIARGVTRSVRELHEASRKVGQGDLNVRVQVSSEDELGAFGHSFNAMINEIARARAELGERMRMARELEIAASIQRALLPPSPEHPDFEFAGRMAPADEVGGDFYDVLHSEDHALWITIGDVSGHGVDAGLVMLMTQAAFASQFRADAKTSPGHALRNVNSLLCENIGNRLKDSKYVTAQLLAYEGKGRFLCAGAHQFPIVFRAASATCETFEVPGPWLGIQNELDEIPLTAIELNDSDILCLYSDGLTEARNLEGELFDTPRLLAAIRDASSRYQSLEEIADAVISKVTEYAARREDDWTLLLVRHTPQHVRRSASKSRASSRLNGYAS